MQKFFVDNRKNQKICVVVNSPEETKGLAFVMHGLSGNKEQSHIQTIAETFIKNSFTTVLFDTTNTFGESDGKFEDATLTNYYEDLEDVINWSKSQPWHQEPFALSGHSLGGYSVAYYAENYPEKVLLVEPISPVISGILSEEAHIKYEPEKYKNWKNTGWREDTSSARPGLLKRLPWSHMEDRTKHDLMPLVKNLTMPILVIVGENDTSTPVEHVSEFYEQIPEPKQFHIIKNAPHTFRSETDLKELYETIDNFIKNYVK